MNENNRSGTRNLEINFTKTLFVFALSAICVFAQTPEDETIRVKTELIQTSVVVTDKNGNFADNLRAEDFELRVDGKQTPIKFFEHFSASGSETNSPDKTVSQTTKNSGAQLSLRERKVIFFIDDLHLSLDSLNRTKQAAEHFIANEMQPLDSVLIVSASGQIGFLQQFTNNKSVLRAALNRIKFMPNAVRDTEPPPMTEFVALRIVNGDREAAEYYVEKILEGFNTKNARGINKNAALEMVKNRANNIVRGLVAVSEASIASLENLLDGIGQIKGRKLVFFASDGFYTGEKKAGVVDNGKLQRAISRATRSGSTIYTIDARGLFTSGGLDASGERPLDPSGNLDKGRLGEDVLSQEGLFVLAEETGGRFLKNQNYFERWIDRMLDENANYYVLAWSAENETAADKKFHRIEASVPGRPELKVRFQRGYLNNSEDKNEAKNKKETIDKKSAYKAVEQKSVSSEEKIDDKKILPLSLSVNYLDVPDAGGVLTTSVEIQTKGLDFGASQSLIDVGGVVLNEQGKQVADFKTGLSVAARGENNEQSIIFNQRTPLAPGIYQIRVGAREAKTGRTGTASDWIEIPDLTARRLALSTVLLGVKAVEKSDKSGDLQVQFSVGHKFPKPLRLDFMTFVYNAQKTSGGAANLSTKIEIFDARGKIIVGTPLRPLATKNIADLSRIPVTGLIRQDAIAPGKYLLRITVFDAAANVSSVRQTIFTVE